MQPAAPFIVGAARSGTTLLRLMLDAHSDLAIPAETGMAALGHRLGPKAPRPVDHVLRELTGLHTWVDLATDAEDLRTALLGEAVEGRIAPADAARAFYSLYAAHAGKRRWGDKTPSHAFELPMIRSMFHEARFLHLIRDGRAVVASIRPLWFRAGTEVEALAGEWVRSVQAARSSGGPDAADYLEVRYEDLVQAPEPTLGVVCEFLGLPYETSMLDYAVGAHERLSEVAEVRSAPGEPLVTRWDRLRNHRLTTRLPEPSRIEAWRDELTFEEVSRVETVAAPLLEELGYRPVSPASGQRQRVATMKPAVMSPRPPRR